MSTTPYHKDWVITCKDHVVSEEEFMLLYDETYDMLITNPQPNIEELPEYYKSEAYISHTDSRRSFFEKAYQLVKNRAIKKKVRRINKLHPQKGKLLDIGAGTGDFLAKAKAKGWEVNGTEPNAKALAIAEEKGIFLNPGIQNPEPQSHDVITMWHVLEHIPDTEKQLSRLKSLLKPEGTLIIAVPNYKSFDAHYYGAHWAAYDVPRHLWHFSKTSITKLCSDNDLEVIRILPMYFDAFYVSLLSEKYKTGRMNIWKAFRTGFLSNYKAFFNTGEYSSLIYIIKHRNNDSKAV